MIGWIAWWVIEHGWMGESVNLTRAWTWASTGNDGDSERSQTDGRRVDGKTWTEFSCRVSILL
jgi:hypothetical protein